jgi:hypothetical protein
MGFVSAEPIGDITEFKGDASLTRQGGEELSVSQGSIPTIELNDTAETQNGRMLIEFLDKAELSLTENTKVYIDKVYYDPDPSKSKMAMRMAMGTARFASGRLGMVNKNNIDIQTPTASITVRGTDFTTTIDELGRSLIVLLPDENGKPSGVIEVSNLGGTVILDEAYAATMVSSLDTAPAPKVVILNVTPNMIDNMFIVSPPQEITDQIEEAAADDLNADQGLLDVDFLEFNELEKDYLANDELEFTELDIDFLDVDFLTDVLDTVDELVRTTAVLADEQERGTGSFQLKGANVGLNKDSQYNVFQQDDQIVFMRQVQSAIRIAVPIDSSVSLYTEVDGYKGDILLNGGTSTIIVIRQGGG